MGHTFCSSFFQERSKISKLHMSETVEELKKFNARRKLKVKMRIHLNYYTPELLYNTGFGYITDI